ncbi:MAG: PorP/SprF family type IX secretion system membrane protein [Bacteroidota bacterium]
MRKLLIMLSTVIFFSANRLEAQVDAHFTQYYANPLWLNPALTGVIDGNSRVTVNYRQQLPGLYAPMQTKGVTADFSLPGNFGLGITALNQSSSDAGYQNTNAYFSLSYRVHLTQYDILSGGFQMGVINKKIDPYKLQFGNQFNPVIGYDPTLPSNEIFDYRSATSFDGSLGLMYFDGDPQKAYNPFFGVSVFHPTQPVNRFLSGGDENKIPIRYAVHGGVRFQMGARAELIPHALYLKQGSNNEIAAGMVCNLTIEEGKGLILGTTWRKDDAVAPNLGLRLGGLTIGLSYDVNISQLKTASSSNGGYELSISFTSQKKIPDTRFICPRL